MRADQEKRDDAWPADGGLGQTPEERRAREKPWENGCVAFNVAAAVLCYASWLPDEMGDRVYWNLLGIIACLPLMGAVFAWFTRGVVDLLIGFASGTQTVFILSISPIALAWRALDWSLVDAWQPWAMALVVAIPLTAIASRLAPRTARNRALRAGVIFVLATLWVGSGLTLTNVRHDRAQPQAFTATVAKSREGTVYRQRRAGTIRGKAFARTTLAPWELAPQGTSLRTRYTYTAGNQCVVHVHPGALRMRWVSIEKCTDPPAPPKASTVEDFFKGFPGRHDGG